MNTLQEIKYYCETKEVAGAFMLTGEWGCGKTYFIENDLKSELENNFIILRISLFGLDSIENIKKLFRFYG